MFGLTKRETEIIEKFAAGLRDADGKEPLCAIYYGEEFTQDIGRICGVPIVRQTISIDDGTTGCEFYPIYYTNRDRDENDRLVRLFRKGYDEYDPNNH